MWYLWNLSFVRKQLRVFDNDGELRLGYICLRFLRGFRKLVVIKRFVVSIPHRWWRFSFSKLTSTVQSFSLEDLIGWSIRNFIRSFFSLISGLALLNFFEFCHVDVVFYSSFSLKFNRHCLVEWLDFHRFLLLLLIYR